MGKRHIRIAELLNETPGQSVVAKGWVRTKRGNKNIASKTSFVIGFGVAKTFAKLE